MSSDHRRRQIDKGSVGRSRERPPDLTRECRPAGTERQISKAQQSIDNSNAKIDSLLKFQKQGARHPAPGAPTRSLAERRSAELRRLRRLRRVQTIADMRAPRLWFEMFDHAARDLGADDYIDTLLERFAGLDCRHFASSASRSIPTSAATAPSGGRPVNGAFPPSIELARLYEKTSQRGTRYLVGRLGLARITLLPGESDEDGTPTWRMLLQEAAKPQPTADRPARNSQRRSPRPRRQAAAHSATSAPMPADSVADLWTDDAPC